MDKIDLPILPADLPLGEALDLLHSARLSGLVTDIAGSPTVLDADALLGGRYPAQTPLAGVAPRSPTVQLPHDDLADAIEREMLHGEMLAAGAVVGVVVPADTAADVSRVVTIAEGVAAQLRTQLAFCRCTGPDGHIVAPGDSATPGICDFDGMPLICQ